MWGWLAIGERAITGHRLPCNRGRGLVNGVGRLVIEDGV